MEQFSQIAGNIEYELAVLKEINETLSLENKLLREKLGIDEHLDVKEIIFSRILDEESFEITDCSLLPGNGDMTFLKKALDEMKAKLSSRSIVISKLKNKDNLLFLLNILVAQDSNCKVTALGVVLIEHYFGIRYDPCENTCFCRKKDGMPKWYVDTLKYIKLYRKYITFKD